MDTWNKSRRSLWIASSLVAMVYVLLSFHWFRSSPEGVVTALAACIAAGGAISQGVKHPALTPSARTKCRAAEPAPTPDAPPE